MDMKQLRERVGLKTVDVASKLKKSEATIRFWELGKNTPTLSVFETQELLGLYRCTFEELFDAARETKEAYDRSKLNSTPRKKGRPPKNK